MTQAATIPFGNQTLYLQADGKTYASKRPAKGLVKSNRANVRAAMEGKAAPKGHKPKRKNKHEESDMQKRCVTWFRMQYKREVLFSVPNGGKLPGTPKERAIAGGILKAEGLLAGVADLVLVHDGGVAFLEAKDSTGTQTDKQRLFQAMVEAMGFKYLIFRSLDEFQGIVNKLIGNE